MSRNTLREIGYQVPAEEQSFARRALKIRRSINARGQADSKFTARFLRAISKNKTKNNMIPALIMGASGLAALWALLSSGESKESFIGNEAILFKDDKEVPLEQRKAGKKLATASEESLQRAREYIAEIVPDDFDFMLTYGRDDEIAISWRLRDSAMIPRVPRIADDNLWNVLKQLQAVNWGNERELADASGRSFKQFGEKCFELQGMLTSRKS